MGWGRCQDQEQRAEFQGGSSGAKVATTFYETKLPTVMANTEYAALPAAAVPGALQAALVRNPQEQSLSLGFQGKWFIWKMEENAGLGWRNEAGKRKPYRV